MNYNINDIMPYIENYHFSDSFSSRDEDFLISAINCEKCPSFDWNDGASKLVIIPDKENYVIKIPFNSGYDGYDDKYDFSQNYCETEKDLYEKILKEEPLFAQFFLPLTRIEEFTEYDIYIQPKCQVYFCTEEKERSLSYSEESLKKVKKKIFNVDTNLPVDWIAALTEVLQDIYLVEEFFNFLGKYDIHQDLHKGNIGYYNNKPVILDYAGFYD